ncbi:MAG TPA: hypothetical protein ENN38_04415 [Actinobacteria bacterium]|nr:hypothetical protein [Actinomycetota bacterium]
MKAKKSPAKTITFGVIVLVLIVLTILLTAINPFADISQTLFCKSCHIMRCEIDSLKNSRHKDVLCLSCHSKPGALGFIAETLEGMQNGIAYFFKSYEEPIVATVTNESCLTCHKEIQEGLHINNAIRVSHKEFLSVGYKCADCHNTVAHGDSIAQPNLPHMDKCTGCHNNEDAPTTCSICHVKRMKREIRALGPWAITHGPTWERTHGMGNLTTCIICHETEKCAKCHTEMPHPESWPYVHGEKAKSVTKEDKCAGCHVESFCDDCHRVEMPHPQKFLPEHPDIVKKDGDKICYNCHIKGDCKLCHEKHIHPGLTPSEIER